MINSFVRRSAILIAASCVFMSSITPTNAQPAEESLGQKRSRTFHFTYGATIQELPKRANVSVWFPIPQNSQHQEVANVELDLPAKAQIELEPVYRNKIAFFQVTSPASGSLSFNASYEVTRHEARRMDGPNKFSFDWQTNNPFVVSNARVPLKGKQLQLLDGLALPAANSPAERSTAQTLSIARQLYDRVDDHVRYDKSKPGYGNGDVHWVCDSRFGNCTDFHSLFISLARSKRIPACFEIGFPLPPARGQGEIQG